MAGDPSDAADPVAVTSVHVRQAMHGDAVSLDWIVSRLSPLLLAQARYRLGAAARRASEPEDLVQDTWLVVLPRLAELTPRDQRYTPVLLRMLSTTLLFRINNLVRLQARRAPLKDDRGHLLEEASAQHTGVVSRAVRREHVDLVTAAIEQLDPKDREAVILCGIEQLPPKAASAILGLEPDAVRMRYRRALDRLRRQLDRSVFDELED